MELAPRPGPTGGPVRSPLHPTPLAGCKPAATSLCLERPLPAPSILPGFLPAPHGCGALRALHPCPHPPSQQQCLPHGGAPLAATRPGHPGLEHCAVSAPRQKGTLWLPEASLPTQAPSRRVLPGVQPGTAPGLPTAWEESRGDSELAGPPRAFCAPPPPSPVVEPARWGKPLTPAAQPSAAPWGPSQLYARGGWKKMWLSNNK